MLINGRAIAEEVYVDLEPRISRARLVLGLVSAGESAVTRSFVNLKKKVARHLNVVVRHKELSLPASTGDVINAIAELSPDVDGLIVQLPLPESVHVEAVMLSVPSLRDVDALNFTLLEKDKLVFPPVVAAILEIFKRTEVEVLDKRAVVLGEGRLVGAPAAEVLKERGARVSIVTRSKGSLRDLREADIIVSGVGSHHLIKPEMIKEGVVLIDAGTSESGGHVAGDADPQCAVKASLFTPTPGGVGPIAVAMIFKNLLALSEQNKKQ